MSVEHSQTSDVDSTEPLLDSSPADCWPQHVTDGVKLIPPKHWSDKETICFMFWDEGVFKIAQDNDDRKILDVIHPEDVIGVRLDSTEGDELAIDNVHTSDVNIGSGGLASVTLSIYCYPRSPNSTCCSCSCGGMTAESVPNASYSPHTHNGPRYANHKIFRIASCEDANHLTQLVKSIRRMAALPVHSEKYLVVINPEAGTGQATSIFRETVEPMLRHQAGMDLDVFETKSPGHATTMIQQQNLLEYRGILVVGGDGSLYELIQGMRARPDAATILQTVELGVLGAGSGNGLAKSVTHHSHEHYAHLESTFLIARGYKIWMDLSLYETQSRSYLSFLTFTWAMIADIDIESERLRWLGESRFDAWGVWRILRLRQYRAKLWYLPPGGDIVLPPLDEPIPHDHWKRIEDDFYLLWTSHVTHATVSNYNSPHSRLGDGLFRIMLVRGKRSRLQIANVLLGLGSGSHANSDSVEFIECVAYRLEPLTPGSYNDLDGEVIEAGPIQAKVMPSAMQLFCRP